MVQKNTAQRGIHTVERPVNGGKESVRSVEFSPMMVALLESRVAELSDAGLREEQGSKGALRIVR